MSSGSPAYTPYRLPPLRPKACRQAARGAASPSLNQLQRSMNCWSPMASWE